mmetsp:Transcript_128107/g.273152  ORF Transcript_128107/g.273152 Transcript_128107/m.273152 type:complete len:444 (-) Transcript_128107:39-1370(-)
MAEGHHTPTWSDDPVSHSSLLATSSRLPEHAPPSRRFFEDRLLHSRPLLLRLCYFLLAYLHLVTDLDRLIRIKIGPHRNAIKLEVSDKISGAAVLDLVQEERLLRRVPIRIAIVDLTIRAAYISADQRHGNGLPIGRLQLRQDLQSLAPYPLRILKEFFRNIVSGYDPFLPVICGHRRLVGNGVQEFAIEPEHACLPVPDKALDGLLDDVLGAIRVFLEVLLQDLRIILALLDTQFREAERESHERLLHHEHLPPSCLDLSQEFRRAPLALKCENGWRHRDPRVHASLHVEGLIVDELLNLPRRHHISARLEQLRHLIDALFPLEDGIDNIVADDEVAHVRLQALQTDVLRVDHVDLNFLVVLLDVPRNGNIGMREAFGPRLAILEVLLAVRVHPVLVWQVCQEGSVTDVFGILHEIGILAHQEAHADRGGHPRFVARGVGHR